MKILMIILLLLLVSSVDAYDRWMNYATGERESVGSYMIPPAERMQEFLQQDQRAQCLYAKCIDNMSIRGYFLEESALPCYKHVLNELTHSPK